MASGGSDSGNKNFKPDAPKVENHFHFGNFNGLITIGTSSGNTINYGPVVRIKLEGPPELFSQMLSAMDGQGEKTSMTLEELQRNCDCALLGFRKGCVELSLRVGSQLGLDRLLAMCESGQLGQLLGREFPVTGARAVGEDVEGARSFFRKERAKRKKELSAKVDEFEAAAGEYVRRRLKTVALLGELAEYIIRRQRQAQAAAAVGGITTGLAVFTLGASLLFSAAAGGVAVGLVAVIVQGVTAKISTDEAKAIMAADKAAGDRVQAALDGVDSKLREWHREGDRGLIDSIHDLVKVDRVNLKRGQEVIGTIEGKGRGEFIQLVVLQVELDRILVKLLDVLSGNVSSLAKAIQEIARKLACPDEASMRELVAKMRRRFPLDV